jgi:hypothetical protein
MHSLFLVLFEGMLPELGLVGLCAEAGDEAKPLGESVKLGLDPGQGELDVRSADGAG